VKLYICWGTFQTPRPGGHPCANAHEAVTQAGHQPEVVKVHGLAMGPTFLNVMTDGRREVEAISGQRQVPVLVTDGGETISGSTEIAAWAESHPVAS